MRLKIIVLNLVAVSVIISGIIGIKTIHEHHATRVHMRKMAPGWYNQVLRELGKAYSAHDGVKYSLSGKQSISLVDIQNQMVMEFNSSGELLYLRDDGQDQADQADGPKTTIKLDDRVTSIADRFLCGRMRISENDYAKKSRSVADRIRIEYYYSLPGLGIQEVDIETTRHGMIVHYRKYPPAYMQI